MQPESQIDPARPWRPAGGVGLALPASPQLTLPGCLPRSKVPVSTPGAARGHPTAPRVCKELKGAHLWLRPGSPFDMETLL